MSEWRFYLRKNSWNCSVHNRSHSFCLQWRCKNGCKINTVSTKSQSIIIYRILATVVYLQKSCSFWSLNRSWHVYSLKRQNYHSHCVAEIIAATTRPVTKKEGEHAPWVDLEKDIFYQHFVIEHWPLTSAGLTISGIPCGGSCLSARTRSLALTSGQPLSRDKRANWLLKLRALQSNPFQKHSSTFFDAALEDSMWQVHFQWL